MIVVRRLGIATVLALLITALFLLAGGPSAPSAFAQNGVCPENPDPVDPDDPLVTVDRPSDGDEVSSPMRVEGEATTFEANVRLTLFDAAGNELVDTFTTAAAGAPVGGPYSTDIEFSVTETQQGCLRVFEESAADGSPVNVVQVELTLKAAPVTPEPPKTGTGGLGPMDSGSLAISVAMLVLAVTLLLSSTIAVALPYRRRD